MNFDELKQAVDDSSTFERNAFQILGEIADLQARGDEDDESRRQARDLVIRCLERRAEMGSARVVHDALLERAGLYPYLEDVAELPLADLIAYEAHRPLVPPRPGFVFHEKQAEVYARLLDGENVILTAPMSFGKSLIVDALIVSGRYANIVLVVPTIALIDETRRRLAELNEEQALGFRVITHPGQAQGERNIFVFTQERVLQEENLPKLDLAVIDEFYKLRLERDPQRAVLLNLALARLRDLSRQLYLLGPSVGEVRELPAEFEHRYIPSHDSTVAFDVINVDRTGDDRTDLVSICSILTEPTLIYAKSPARAHDFAGWLVDAGLGGGGVDAAAEWVAANYHPEWSLVAALRSGVGVHHGRMPRSLAHYQVAAFNNEMLRFLICTQTLIEGVNTTAKNIVIVDDTIDRRKLDLFTFRNIMGRSGRMFEHFVGRVFLFNPPPQDELPAIEIPALSQPDDAPTELLLGLRDEELSSSSRDRIAPYLEQDVLSLDVLRNNRVDPDAQIALATSLHDSPEAWSARLGWSRFPNYDELLAVVELIWTHFTTTARRWGAFSPSQCTFMALQSSYGRSLKELIAEQLAYWSQRNPPWTVDQVVLSVLTFQRSGLTFGLPKYLRVVDAIQKDVLGRYGLKTGDYTQFAAAAEAAFRAPALAALDEYGIPPELADRLGSRVLPSADATLDEVLERLRALAPEDVTSNPFELDLLRDAKRGA